MNDRRGYIVAYDISQPRRLKKIHSIMLGYGIPIQYSIFYVAVTQARKQKMLDDLIGSLDEALDDIRLYPIAKVDLNGWINHSISADNSFLQIH